MEKANDLMEYFFNFDVILLNETWIKSSSDLDYNIPKFKMIMQCRVKSNVKAKRASGGLICYIREKIYDGVQQVEWKYKVED